MKFLVSQMAAVKLRLLERFILAKERSPFLDSLAKQKVESHKMSVCQAVEDRICKRMDLASRTDLTNRQALDAIRLLLKIVRENNLAVDFSPGESSLLAHADGVRPDSAFERLLNLS